MRMLGSRSTQRRCTNSGGAVSIQSDNILPWPPSRRKKKEKMSKKTKLDRLWQTARGETQEISNWNDNLYLRLPVPSRISIKENDTEWWLQQECEGLTDRLRICHNSSEPSSVESVKLYIIAYKYWDACAADCGGDIQKKHQRFSERKSWIWVH